MVVLRCPGGAAIKNIYITINQKITENLAVEIDGNRGFSSWES